MAKITYSSLKLKMKEDIKEIDFNGNKIEVKQYLSVSDKIDLVDATLQKSKENNLYDPIKVNMYFHLYLIYLYTNITFTEKQREDEEKLYDILDSNGLINEVIMAIPENEYEDLLNKINEKMENEIAYNTTFAGFITKFIDEIPGQTEEMNKIMENFDQDKFKEIVNFVKAANGNRDI